MLRRQSPAFFTAGLCKHFRSTALIYSPCPQLLSQSAICLSASAQLRDPVTASRNSVKLILKSSKTGKFVLIGKKSSNIYILLKGLKIGSRERLQFVVFLFTTKQRVFIKRNGDIFKQQIML